MGIEAMSWILWADVRNWKRWNLPNSFSVFSCLLHFGGAVSYELFFGMWMGECGSTRYRRWSDEIGGLTQ